ncbi:MAG: hypothetical protein J0M21_12795, partial [Xanthomonadales bacterium]|nr:hypothetical protein [Xanthomonadales bacterium]
MAGLGAADIERLHAAARAIRDRQPALADRLLGEVLAAHPAHAILSLSYLRGSCSGQPACHDENKS